MAQGGWRLLVAPSTAACRGDMYRQVAYGARDIAHEVRSSSAVEVRTLSDQTLDETRRHLRTDSTLLMA
jgi:hypothetical protein